MKHYIQITGFPADWAKYGIFQSDGKSPDLLLGFCFLALLTPDAVDIVSAGSRFPLTINQVNDLVHSAQDALIMSEWALA